MRRDSLVSRNKETEVSSLSQDKGTTGKAQNLAMGRAWKGFWHFATGQTGTRRNVDILPRDGPGRNFDSLTEGKKRKKKYNFW